MPTGLGYDFFDFANGAADSFSFGLTSVVRDWTGLYVNTCGTAYTAGEWAETGAEIVLTGGSAILKTLAKGTIRAQVRKAAAEEMSKQGISATTGMVRHHILPLFGHPGGMPALFPTGGLPASIHSHQLNITRLRAGAEHSAAHRNLRSIEGKLEASVMNPSLTGLRAAGNAGCR